MMANTTQQLRHDKRGVSNVIVVMLSLILIVIIVSNVVLWSYQMNQLDWQRIQEDVALVKVEPHKEAWLHHPSEYALSGSTTLLSGQVSDLAFDDNVSMVFRSYNSTNSNLHFVNTNSSDVDSSGDRGTHSSFPSQQAGPDSIYDTLTEASVLTDPSNVTLIGRESFEGAWPPSLPSNWTKTGRWNKESDRSYDLTFSADFDGSGSGDLTTCDLDCSNVPNAIYIDFWYRDEGCEATEVLLKYYNGTAWKTVRDLGSTTSEYQWLHYQDRVADPQYFVSTFKIRWSAAGVDSNEHIYIDYVTVEKEVNADYKLDQEVQWTNVDYDETNEWLCIYAGTIGAEDVRVDVWNGTSWNNIFIDLQSGWNNISVSSYLDQPDFTIRFRDSSTVSDTFQDSWSIDVALLHVWSNGYRSEVEFTGISNTEEWNELNWTVDSSWTTSSVEVTLQLYNYALGDFPASGNGFITYTSNSSPNTHERKVQTISIDPTHFRSASGHWKLKIAGFKASATQFDLKVDWIELEASKNGGTLFAIENKGSLTFHLVSLWVNHAGEHRRYDLNLFINSGDMISYVRSDIDMPEKPYAVKVVTERGNIAIVSENN